MSRTIADGGVEVVDNVVFERVSACEHVPQRHARSPDVDLEAYGRELSGERKREMGSERRTQTTRSGVARTGR